MPWGLWGHGAGSPLTAQAEEEQEQGEPQQQQGRPHTTPGHGLLRGFGITWNGDAASWEGAQRDRGACDGRGLFLEDDIPLASPAAAPLQHGQVCPRAVGVLLGLPTSRPRSPGLGAGSPGHKRPVLRCTTG